MFKIKAKSKYKVIVGDVYNVHGHLYEITRIGFFSKKPVAYGISINGGKEEALFYLDALELREYKKYIQKIEYKKPTP